MSHKIIDESAHSNFLIVPNIIFGLKLSNSALRLYLWFKGVAGDKGVCWQSLDTISVGCWMSVPTIIKARKELEEIGLILVTKKILASGAEQVHVSIENVWDANKDADDVFNPKKRQKRLLEEGNSADLINFNQGAKKLKAPIKDIKLGYKESLHKQDIKANKIKGGSKAAAPRQNGLLPENWQNKAAKELHKILAESGADLVVRMRVKVSTLAKQIVRLSTEGKVSKEEIKKVFQWLREHYKDNHTPKIYKVADLYNSWGRFRDARFRWLEDNGMDDSNGNGQGKVTVRDIRNALQTMGCSLDPDQEDINMVSAGLGVAVGTFTVKDLA